MTTCECRKQAIAEAKELVQKFSLTEAEVFGKSNYAHYVSPTGEHWIGKVIPDWLVKHIQSGKRLDELIVRDDPFMEPEEIFEDKDPAKK